MGATEKSFLSYFVFRLLMECWAAQPLGGLGWVGSLDKVADCLGFVLKEIYVNVCLG